MKILFVASVALISFNSFAGETLENCQVSKMINSNILEESLSIDEYPQVSIDYDEMDGLTLELGMNSFMSGVDGFVVKPVMTLATVGAFGFEAASKKLGESFNVSGQMVNHDGVFTKEGTVTYTDLSTGLSQVLAEITCDL